MVPSEKARGNGYKLNYRKFYLSIKEKLFYCEGEQTLELVAQRDCGVTIPGDTQNLTGHGCEQPVLAEPDLSRRAGLINLQRSLLTSSIL